MSRYNCKDNFTIYSSDCQNCPSYRSCLKESYEGQEDKLPLGRLPRGMYYSTKKEDHYAVDAMPKHAKKRKPVLGAEDWTR